MKINLNRDRWIFVIILASFTVLIISAIVSCQSDKQRCSHEICLRTFLVFHSSQSSNVHDFYGVELEFLSSIDKIFILDEQMYEVGCLFFQEAEGNHVMGKMPVIENMKNSQLVLENKEGEFRFFSSQLFLDLNDPIRMPNCSFMGKERVEIKKNHLKKIKFNVLTIDDLKVKKTDRKIRLHLYYKDSIGKGIILTSDNWLSLK